MHGLGPHIEGLLVTTTGLLLFWLVVNSGTLVRLSVLRKPAIVTLRGIRRLMTLNEVIGVVFLSESSGTFVLCTVLFTLGYGIQLCL